MADTRRLTRTVAFWRLVEAPSLTPVGEVDWPAFLTAVAKRAAQGKSRHTIYDAEVAGTVYPRDEVDHLVLTRNRDDLPRQQHRSTGIVADMITTDEEWSVIESSFVKFLPFGNVFGLLQSQNTAPSPQVIAKWINATRLLDGPELAVEAVVDPERWNHMRAAGGVSSLEFAAPSAVLDRVVTGPLDHLIGPAKFGNLKVRVKVSASRSRKSAAAREDRRRLYEATEELAKQVGAENLDTVKVKVFDEDLRGIKAGSVNLLRQRFTIRRNIRLRSGVNASVSESSAFDAIITAAVKFEDDLRAAVREDPMAR